MPPRDTYGVVSGNTRPAGSAASPTSRGFGSGAVDPAAPIAAPQRSFGTFNADGTVQGPGQAARPGARPAPTPGASAAPTSSPRPQARPEAGGGGAGGGAGLTEPERTAILDAPRSPVTITEDTFLQSTNGGVTPCGGGGGLLGALGAGSLASGLLGNLLSNLPPVAQGLLNATGLTGALAGIAGEIDGALSDALGEMSQALNNAAGSIFNDISNAVTSIPGLGPAVQNISSVLTGFNNNLQSGFAGLDPVLQQGIAGAVGAVGANINNPILRTGFNTLFTPAQARNIASGVQFNLNPALQIQQLAGAATSLNPIVSEFFGNNAFGELQARSQIAATQLGRAVVPGSNGGFGLTLNIPNNNPNFSRVLNGVIQNPETLISNAQSQINNRLQQLTSGGFSIRF